MILVVHGIGIIIVSINPIDVVDIAVAVIIFTVGRDFLGVFPHVDLQVLVVVIHPGIDDPDYDITGPGLFVPGFRGIDISIGGPTGLTGIMHPP